MLKFRDNLASLIEDFAIVGKNLNYIAIIDIVYWGLKNQCTGIFHGVEENRRDFTAEADTAGALIGYAGHIVTKEP